MAMREVNAVRGISARRMFLWVALIVSGLCALGIGLIAADQQRVLSNTTRMQEQTVPTIMTKQRLARNLEQLRAAGDDVFDAMSDEGRQQALFMTELITTHPSIQDDARASALVKQTKQLFAQDLPKGALLPATLAKYRAQWQRLSKQLGLLIDDMFNDSILLASQELSVVTDIQTRARYKLVIILALFIGIVLLLLWSAHALLVIPLQRIDQLLTEIDAVDTLPLQKASPLREITAVQAALRALHELLKQKEQTRQTLERMAEHDDLTGLLNRRKFMDRAMAELNRDHRNRRPVAVAMVDIDFFKSINDSYGHTGGDQVLKAFAEILKKDLRESDLVGRVGGEEFAFVLPETGPEAAEHLMERIRSTVQSNPIELADGRRVQATISVGVADAANSSLPLALRHADIALYSAKSKGRNRVEVHPVAAA
jgi:diguanylate cyclase (GGDEF)-like protein